MPREFELAAQRFAVFADQVLAPAVHSVITPLHASVHQTASATSFDRARQAEYRPVDIGFRWGPVWSTAWFRLTGRVPAASAGRPVVLRFSCGTEALLWKS